MCMLPNKRAAMITYAEGRTGIKKSAIIRKLSIPPWQKYAEIRAIKEEAMLLSQQTGVRHTVDHVWPIAGEDFCGLTVPWNLRIVPHKDNLAKANKRPDNANKSVAFPQSI